MGFQTLGLVNDPRFAQYAFLIWLSLRSADHCAYQVLQSPTRKLDLVSISCRLSAVYCTRHVFIQLRLLTSLNRIPNLHCLQWMPLLLSSSHLWIEYNNSMLTYRLYSPRKLLDGSSPLELSTPLQHRLHLQTVH